MSNISVSNITRGSHQPAQINDYSLRLQENFIVSERSNSQQGQYDVERQATRLRTSQAIVRLPIDQENQTRSFLARSIFELENSRTEDRSFEAPKRVPKLSGRCCMYILSGHSLKKVNKIKRFLDNHEEIFVPYYIDRINVANVQTGEPLMFFHVKNIKKEKKFVSAMKRFIRREAKKPNYQKMVFVEIQKILKFSKDNELKVELEKRLEEQGHCITVIHGEDKWIKFKSLYVAGSFAAMLSCPFEAYRYQFWASEFFFQLKEYEQIEGSREEQWSDDDDEIKQLIQELKSQQQRSLQVAFLYHSKDDQEGYYGTRLAKSFYKKVVEEYKVVKLSHLDVSWQT